jgi:hypothetical protein
VKLTYLALPGAAAAAITLAGCASAQTPYQKTVAELKADGISPPSSATLAALAGEVCTLARQRGAAGATGTLSEALEPEFSGSSGSEISRIASVIIRNYCTSS